MMYVGVSTSLSSEPLFCRYDSTATPVRTHRINGRLVHVRWDLRPRRLANIELVADFLPSLRNGLHVPLLLVEKLYFSLLASHPTSSTRHSSRPSSYHIGRHNTVRVSPGSLAGGNGDSGTGKLVVTCHKEAHVENRQGSPPCSVFLLSDLWLASLKSCM
jgi:hypothetical protein